MLKKLILNYKNKFSTKEINIETRRLGLPIVL